MKLLRSAVVTLVLGLLTPHTFGQCTAATSFTQNYDTTVTGSGNDIHTFSFPKFNASLGTLLDVTISATVTLSYDFRLENLEGVRINTYKVRLVRDEEISSDALTTPLDNSFQKTYGSYSLAANNGVQGSGPDYLRVGPTLALNQVANYYTVYNTADFMGSGTVDFDYISSTYSIVFGSLNYSFNASANETMQFQVAYHYCSAAQLSSGFTMFTANRKTEMVSLNWNVVNEQANTSYHIQASSNGTDYRTIKTIMSNSANNGRYEVNVPTEQGKTYYRILGSGVGIEDNQSAVRIVNDGQLPSEGMRLYPNPAHGMAEIIFDKTKRSDYTVYAYTPTGQLAARYEFKNALLGKINTRSELKPGVYLIRVTKISAGEPESRTLIIQ